ncbi:hypothetical protein ASZ78_006944 [Callipepla squamata]|uniref:Hyaluronidase n=1 Tax=Callipepla squamata TaxID=9009 RepID=A0A226MSD2_CALSU|nr:hypothetical protein ASZ78_006944 [Callipepla squamata]
MGMGPALALWAWLRRFGVGLPLSDYSIVENQGGRFAGQNITIFYKNKFGLGLAVVDWEEWRPLWAQNWGSKRIYQLASQRLRPAGLWGFYRFPDCFNGNWAKVANYTGRCRPTEVRRNDHLRWLWAASAALYPSIYLPPLLPPGLRRRYVHHRLREALRVAIGRLPVVAYSRLSYRRSPRFLEPADLEHTIGESAALGAAGVVLWGDLSYSRSAESCSSLRHYLVSTLGPYVANVTAAAQACSSEQCQGHGRCVRRQPQELGSMLHLADGVGRAEGTVPSEPTDPDGMDPGAISLHPVASISDLHWASAGYKGTEGNGPAPSSSRLRCAPRSPPHLPTLRPVPPPTICPCPGHPFFFILLGLLALASLILATLAIYLSVLQSQSVQALAQWLESQEDAMRQLRAASGQLWARLNASAQHH